MKLYVDVYRNGNGDCTNGGVSSKWNDFIFISQDEITNVDYGRKDTTLVLVSGPYDTLRAVPLELYINDTWVMFGGNFIFTSDSRFPSNQPIKIFDRVEN